ncbi:MAG: amidase family protein, partial [Chloroflexota bacterium]|nr:amidase family protein [Chloroflexota bacterium]
MGLSNLVAITASEARRLLDDKEISSVELTKEHLKRISNTEKNIDAYVTVTEDKALEEAQLADERIAAGTQTNLTGIPMQLKD